MAHAPLRCRLRLRPILGHEVALHELLGDAEQAFAPLHLLPYLARAHAGGRPHHDEIVEEIGALAHDGIAVAVDRVDDDLDRFFGELLGDLGAAGAKQARGARYHGIGVPSLNYRFVKSLDRISHAAKINRKSPMGKPGVSARWPCGTMGPRVTHCVPSRPRPEE